MFLGKPCRVHDLNRYRGRTIAISDSAVISRRDGILKFMFRIADFRRTQARAAVIACSVCCAASPAHCCHMVQQLIASSCYAYCFTAHTRARPLFW